jgi:hypothetical protein
MVRRCTAAPQARRRGGIGSREGAKAHSQLIPIKFFLKYFFSNILGIK